MGLIFRLSDVPDKPVVRVVESVAFHPHYSDMVRQAPSPICREESGVMVPCPALYERGLDYPSTPWHVWLTEPNHAIYDGWAVEILEEQEAKTFIPPPHTLTYDTPLLRLQREYMQRVRPVDGEYLYARAVPERAAKPQGVKPAPAVVGSIGWLCPKGRFYPCQSWQHDEWECLHGRWFSPYGLVSVGWVKVSEGKIKGTEPLTQDQLDTLFDLGLFAYVEAYNV